MAQNNSNENNLTAKTQTSDEIRSASPTPPKTPPVPKK